MAEEQQTSSGLEELHTLLGLPSGATAEDVVVRIKALQVYVASTATSSAELEVKEKQARGLQERVDTLEYLVGDREIALKQARGANEQLKEKADEAAQGRAYAHDIAKNYRTLTGKETMQDLVAIIGEQAAYWHERAGNALIKSDAKKVAEAFAMVYSELNNAWPGGKKTDVAIPDFINEPAERSEEARMFLGGIIKKLEESQEREGRLEKELQNRDEMPVARPPPPEQEKKKWYERHPVLGGIVRYAAIAGVAGICVGFIAGLHYGIGARRREPPVPVSIADGDFREEIEMECEKDNGLNREISPELCSGRYGYTGIVLGVIKEDRTRAYTRLGMVQGLQMKKFIGRQFPDALKDEQSPVACYNTPKSDNINLVFPDGTRREIKEVSGTCKEWKDRNAWEEVVITFPPDSEARGQVYTPEQLFGDDASNINGMIMDGGLSSDSGSAARYKSKGTAGFQEKQDRIIWYIPSGIEIPQGIKVLEWGHIERIEKDGAIVLNERAVGETLEHIFDAHFIRVNGVQYVRAGTSYVTREREKEGVCAQDNICRSGYGVIKQESVKVKIEQYDGGERVRYEPNKEQISEVFIAVIENPTCRQSGQEYGIVYADVTIKNRRIDPADLDTFVFSPDLHCEPFLARLRSTIGHSEYHVPDGKIVLSYQFTRPPVSTFPTPEMETNQK